MKVIHVPRRFVRSDWGGTETVVLQTAKRMAARGWDTAVFTSMALASEPVEIFDGVTVKRFPYFYPWWGLDAGSRDQMDRKGGNLMSWALWRALQREPGVDLLHLHTLKRLGGTVRTVSRRRRIPYVVTLHGGLYDVPDQEFDSVTSPFRNAFEWGKPLGWLLGSRRVVPDADAVICVGDRERRQVEQRFPDVRVETIPNGVDIDRFSHGNGHAFREQFDIPLDGRMILVMGRIDPQKNQRGAVEAFSILRKRHPDLYLVLIGHVTNPVYRDELARDVSRLGLDDRVRIIDGLPGDSDALVDAYHAADVLLTPSVHEPFGIVILEAWAAGLAVAASRVGGIPSFVDDQIDGLLFDPSDTVCMVSALDALLANDSLRQRIAHAGMQKARDRYSWDRITDRLVTLYADVIQRHSGGRK